METNPNSTAAAVAAAPDPSLPAETNPNSTAIETKLINVSKLLLRHKTGERCQNLNLPFVPLPPGPPIQCVWYPISILVISDITNIDIGGIPILGLTYPRWTFKNPLKHCICNLRIKVCSISSTTAVSSNYLVKLASLLSSAMVIIDIIQNLLTR